jgi:hypothetical protein
MSREGDIYVWGRALDQEPTRNAAGFPAEEYEKWGIEATKMWIMGVFPKFLGFPKPKMVFNFQPRQVWWIGGGHHVC